MILIKRCARLQFAQPNEPAVILHYVHASGSVHHMRYRVNDSENVKLYITIRISTDFTDYYLDLPTRFSAPSTGLLFSFCSSCSFQCSFQCLSTLRKLRAWCLLHCVTVDTLKILKIYYNYRLKECKLALLSYVSYCFASNAHLLVSSSVLRSCSTIHPMSSSSATTPHTQA